jgi:hypothetical protein
MKIGPGVAPAQMCEVNDLQFFFSPRHAQSAVASRPVQSKHHLTQFESRMSPIGVPPTRHPHGEVVSKSSSILRSQDPTEQNAEYVKMLFLARYTTQEKSWGLGLSRGLNYQKTP